MKTLWICILSIASIGTLYAQNTLQVNVINAKGKYLGSKAVVYLKSDPVPKSPEKEASVTLSPTAGDTLFVMAGKSIGRIPTDGLTDLTIVADKGKMTDKATGKEFETRKLPAFDPNNISEMPDLAVYPDLESLITTKFSTVRIKNGDAYLTSNMNGPSTSDSPMLIVVDNHPVQNFTYANEVISLRDIKSIVIKRSEPLYGMRGAGGVMEITLVDGKDF